VHALSEDDKNEFVTLATFQDVGSAQFYQEILSQNGIESFLPDENAAALLFPPMTYSMGGVRLEVAETDLERASEILKSAMEATEGPGEEQEGEQSQSDLVAMDDPEGKEIVDDAENDTEYVEPEEGAPQVADLSGLRYLLGIVLLAIFAMIAYYAVNLLAPLIAK
jgi:hypothetical protein